MVVTSEAISGMINREQLTLMPSLTSAAAWARLASVIRFKVPIWSSFPQRPQLLRESIHPITSSSEGMFLVAMCFS